MNSTDVCLKDLAFDENTPEHSIIIGILYTALFYPPVIVTDIWYWSRKDHWPLSARRNKVLYLIPTIGYLLSGFCLSMRDIAGRAHFSCDLFTIGQILWFPFTSMPLLINWYILHNSLKFQNNVVGKTGLLHERLSSVVTRNAAENLGKTRKHAEKRFRRLNFMKSSLFAAIIGIFAFALVFIIAILNMSNNEKLFMGCKGCVIGPNDMVVFASIAFLALVLCCTLLFLTWKDTDVSGAIREMRIATAFWALVCVLWMPLELFDPNSISLNEQFNWSYIWATLGFIPTHVLTIVLPAYKTYNKTKKTVLQSKRQLLVNDNTLETRSFSEILDDRDGIEAFQQYLISEFAVENLEFLLQANAWRELYDTMDSSKSAENAFDMFDYYVRSGSLLEINVKDDSRKECEAAFTELKKQRGSADLLVPKTIFDELIQEIHHLLKTDSFPRFIHSKLYDAYVAVKLGASKRILYEDDGSFEVDMESVPIDM